MKRQINFGIGLALTGIGILGAFLPVLPSTCFFISAAYFFGKSSERLENWILNHPQFGPSVVQWRQHRAIPRAGKIAAFIGMGFSSVALLASPAPLWAIALGLVVLAGSAWYVGTRPTLSEPAPSSNLR